MTWWNDGAAQENDKHQFITLQYKKGTPVGCPLIMQLLCISKLSLLNMYRTGSAQRCGAIAGQTDSNCLRELPAYTIAAVMIAIL